MTTKEQFTFLVSPLMSVSIFNFAFRRSIFRLAQQQAASSAIQFANNENYRTFVYLSVWHLGSVIVCVVAISIVCSALGEKEREKPKSCLPEIMMIDRCIFFSSQQAMTKQTVLQHDVKSTDCTHVDWWKFSCFFFHFGAIGWVFKQPVLCIWTGYTQ